MTSSTDSPRLLRNTILNLVGQVIPIVVAVLSIPSLLASLGTERFGILALIWIFVGYFSLFDLGLGRALTQVMSRRFGEGDFSGISAMTWTALTLMGLLGVAASLIVGVASPWLVDSVLDIPESMKDETVESAYILAASIPVVISSAGLVGILGALQRFDVINLIRVPLGAYTFLAPLWVASFSQDLYLVTLVLVAGRVVGLGLHLGACLLAMPALRSDISWDFNAIKPLLRFGIWMTVSNIASPLMLYADRFVLAAAASLSAVAYYSIPYEVVVKILIVPGALSAVFFPAIAASFFVDREEARDLFRRGIAYLLPVLFPIILLVVAFSPECLAFWLNADFSNNSNKVLSWLALGVFINGLAYLAFSLVQGAGRADLTAKLHCFELVVYIPVLWCLVLRYGIVGAAIAWTGRVAIDALVLFFLANRFLGLRISRIEVTMLGMVCMILVFVLFNTKLGVQERLLTTVCMLALSSYLLWTGFHTGGGGRGKFSKSIGFPARRSNAQGR